MKKLALVMAVIMMATCFAVSANAADGKAVADSADLYISFDGEIKDDAGNHTVEIVGEIPLVEGHAGTAGRLVSTADVFNYIKLPDLKLGTESFTLSWWYMMNTEEWGEVNFFGNMADNHGFCVVMRHSGKDQYNLYNYCNNEATGCAGFENMTLKFWRDNSLIKNVWANMTVVWNREVDGYVHWYLNGEKQYGDNGSAAVESDVYPVYSRYGHDFDHPNYAYVLGQYTTGNGGPVDWSFDEFYVFKRALTADEVVALYTYVPEVAEESESESESQTDADTTINEDVNNGDAPQTFDFAVIGAIAAIVSAAGYAISKKR